MYACTFHCILHQECMFLCLKDACYAIHLLHIPDQTEGLFHLEMKQYAYQSHMTRQSICKRQSHRSENFLDDRQYYPSVKHSHTGQKRFLMIDSIKKYFQLFVEC